MELIFIFILGLIVGSFLNVVALRYNTGKSLSGRSGCFSCGGRLRWYELIPVISFFAQEGRCRRCKSALSLQYPLVELVTGALFLLSALHYGFSLATLSVLPEVLFAWLFFALLLVIVVYDIRHHIIPNGLSFALALLTVTRALALGLYTSLLAGFLLFLFFWALWYFSAGRWMGFGDAKLAVGLGAFLGLSQVFAALTLSFWIGALYGLVMLSLPRSRATLKSEVPFAPFLALGTTLSFFFNVHLSTILSWFKYLSYLW